MEARVRQLGDVSVVDLRGRLNVGEGDIVLRDQVGELLEQGQQYILLNLEEVSCMDARGLGELAACYRSARENGATIKLLSPSAKVYDLLELTQLDEIFETFRDETEALVSFASSVLAQRILGSRGPVVCSL